MSLDFSWPTRQPQLPLAGYRAVMHENLATGLLQNEAIALLAREPLHLALHPRHAVAPLLGRLPKPTAAATASSGVSLPLSHLARLLVMLLALEIGEYPSLLYLPLEATEDTVEIVTLADRNLNHGLSLPRAR